MIVLKKLSSDSIKKEQKYCLLFETHLEKNPQTSEADIFIYVDKIEPHYLTHVDQKHENKVRLIFENGNFWTEKISNLCQQYKSEADKYNVLQNVNQVERSAKKLASKAVKAISTAATNVFKADILKRSGFRIRK